MAAEKRVKSGLSQLPVILNKLLHILGNESLEDNAREKLKRYMRS